MSAQTRKLDGVRVLDLSLFLPGPHLTLMMADHGAEVIKLEPPGDGEPVRNIGLQDRGQSVWFRNTHRGKKSVCINLKHPEGKEALLRLAESVDVVVEAFRPGVAKRLGIDSEALLARNPALVYCSISAFGQDGPDAMKPAHDLAVQCNAGLVSVNLGQDRQPALPGVPAADMSASLMALSGILMALLKARQTGRGDFIDISMQDCLIAWTPNVMGPVFAEQRPPIPWHERSWGGGAMNCIYRTSDDKYLCLGGSELKFATNLLTALGREDLIELCALPPGPKQDPVREFFAETFATRTLADWQEFLDQVDVCWAPVRDLHEAVHQPQVLARDMLLTDADGGEHLGIPIRFAQEPGEVDFRLPKLGEHNREVLAAIGYSDADLDALSTAGTLQQESA